MGGLMATLEGVMAYDFEFCLGGSQNLPANGLFRLVTWYLVRAEFAHCPTGGHFFTEGVFVQCWPEKARIGVIRFPLISGSWGAM